MPFLCPLVHRTIYFGIKGPVRNGVMGFWQQFQNMCQMDNGLRFIDEGNRNLRKKTNGLQQIIDWLIDLLIGWLID